jgi:hypothetical protein
MLSPSGKVEKRIFSQRVAHNDQMSQFNPSPHQPKSPVDDIWREEKGSLSSMDKDVELPNMAAEQRRVGDQQLQGLGDAKLQEKVHQSVAKHPHMPPSVMNHKSPQ